MVVRRQALESTQAKEAPQSRLDTSHAQETESQKRKRHIEECHKVRQEASPSPIPWGANPLNLPNVRPTIGGK